MNYIENLELHWEWQVAVIGILLVMTITAGYMLYRLANKNQNGRV